MRLILEGDKRKSKQWIPWAELQLSRIKTSGNLVINQAFKPVRGILVHVRSVNNNDFIRIYATQEKESCKAEFTFEITGSFVFFTPGNNLCFKRLLWDWGDGQYTFQDTAAPIAHTYERTGNYTVTLHNYTLDPTVASVYGNVTQDVLHAWSGTTSIGFSFVSNAHSYSEFLFNNPTNPPYFGSIPNSRYHTGHIDSGLAIWRHENTNLVFDVPLSNISADTAAMVAINEGRAWIWIFGTFCSYISYDDDGASKPIIHSFLGSDLGATPWEAATPTTRVTMLNPTSLVDTKASVWDQSTLGIWPPSILPDPALMSLYDVPANERRSGWQCPDVTGGKLYVTAWTEKMMLSKDVIII
jgi:hypothetical protein